jgi:Tol biopolymer transport system component
VTLQAGQTLGHYEILASLGAGGMGEVYRASDPRLGRDVALKVLPPAFASDPERLARFEREARVLASLDHPAIGAIHGLEEADGVKALVLELVEGPTLQDRIAHGPIPLDEALGIARQIADALEAAHEKGVVHRDLKPANVKVRPDGAVKVLDFGLAKALEPQPAAAELSQSPTLSFSAAATRMGVVLGTAAYMAPEQARGRPVDKRADIWSFGCVLYEMLAGRRAFDGETMSDTLAAILAHEPDWSAIPTDTPARLVELLRRCLAKDPRVRLRDIGDARFEIDRAGSPVEASSRVDEAPARGARGHGRRTAGALLLGVGAGALAAWSIATWLARDEEPGPAVRAPVRFAVELPSGVHAAPLGAAVSADGRSIAFVGERPAESVAGIWIRSIDEVEPRFVPGTRGGQAPFWSPDGAWLGFFADGNLKRVRIAGGPAETLCDTSAEERSAVMGLGASGTWNHENVILFSTDAASGLLRVDAGGGTPTVLTTPDTSRGEQGHLWPRFLPDGRRFAYTVVGPSWTPFAAVESLDGDSPRAIFAADVTPIFTAGGTMAFRRGAAILAQRVDFTTLVAQRDPGVLADGLAQYQPGSFHGAAGTVVYHSEAGRTTLAWFDREGRPLATVASGVRMANPALSPSGGRIAVERANESGVHDVWSFDERGASSQLASERGQQRTDAVWAPDGERLVTSRSWGRELVELGPSGEERVVLARSAGGNVYATDWSADGEHLLYVDFSFGSGDVWMLPLAEPEKAVALVRTEALDHQARFSPDGRWIAYASNDSDRPEVYVRPMPPAAGRTQISTAGGAQPMWRADGSELFYVSLDGMLHSVAIELGATLELATPAPLFRLSLTDTPFVGVRNDYAVSPDGQRFLVAGVDTADRAKINVVVDWETVLEE